MKGIFQDGEYVRTELVNQPSDITIQESFFECVEKGFKRLPLAMKIFVALRVLLFGQVQAQLHVLVVLLEMVFFANNDSKARPELPIWLFF
ncbi:hypothetical protein P5G51_015170 [Virgibacillus sp. 179-BFC.A HS]|uniref:Uncharacterized protein n=1 Tax=Tigheibacillus jepli TaxID=3035914 RepID=A0ABU5CM45_9BACI|nr:hypothetical protein [Virgibacillus sp. 179-BFC.A HS]MDY0406525.1 hypothetical protein [Virgibacillus sp. 179-BFC.A HS]